MGPPQCLADAGRLPDAGHKPAAGGATPANEVVDLFGDAGDNEHDQMLGAMMTETEVAAGERREANESIELSKKKK